MIPLMKNAFLNEYETKKALAEFILKTNKFSMGEKCIEFENKFANFHKRKHAVLFNSGGSSNLAMLQTFKNLGRLKDDAKIGFSALTWSTNVMPIIQLGMVPVALDCDPEYINVMSYNLEKYLENNHLDAFFVTNVLGFSGDLHKIKKLCAEKKIILFEDNCESLGSELEGTLTGNFGEMASSSFFVAHHMSTIEGGMVVTDDDELANMLRIVRANGWDRNLKAADQFKLRKDNGITSEFIAKYTFYDLGYNLRPTEITGFIGSYQIEFLPENIKKREGNYLKLEAISKENDELVTVKHEHMNVVSSFSYPVICKSSEIRDHYVAQFSGAGIEIRPMIAGNIQKQPFYKKYVNTNEDLPGTDLIHNNGFYFGNYPELTDSDLEVISNCLRKY